MKKAIVVYGSITGTTEEISRIVEKEIRAVGLSVIVKNVSAVSPRELSNYEAIVLGCSTWGDGELQDDFIGFEEKMRSMDLKGKKCAVFGPGDSIYPKFCKAVDILEETLEHCGAYLIKDGMKVDVSKGDFKNDVRVWARAVAAELS